MIQDGYPVILLACHSGMTRCLLGTNPEHPKAKPPCKGCIEQSKRMYPENMTSWIDLQLDQEFEKSLKDKTLGELLKVQFSGLPLGEIVLPSLRWILRRQNLKDDEHTRSIYRDYLRSARSIAISFSELVEKKDPRAVVVFNGQFFPEATIKRIARNKSIPVFSHEVALQPLSAFFTDGEATAYPIHIPKDFQLNREQDRRLDDVLEKRFQGKFSMAGIQFWSGMQPIGEDFWKQAGFFDQIVTIFTNVIFDTSQSHANVLYEDMFAWLEDILTLIHDTPRTFFVIRAHPDETRPGKESRESVSDWVARKGVDRLSNVLYVGPDESLSSYQLIQKSKFVMVYNSTIGLEASILGAVVLCGGKARFTQVESVFFPESRSEYKQMACEFLAAKKLMAPGIHQLNARKFLYFQLFRTSLPFSEFLQETDYWKGYVKLKDFPLEALRAENSVTMRVIQEGILKGAPFLIPDEWTSFRSQVVLSGNSAD